MNATEIALLCDELTGYERRSSFEFILKMMLDRNPAIQCIVETGTYRGGGGDGNSTLMFAHLARETGATFYSVDITPECIERSKAMLGDLQRHAIHVCRDSIAFLSTFKMGIDLLYLDSFDVDVANTLPAQIHQLAETGAAYGKLNPGAVIMLDDCRLPNGGKGALTSKFLEDRGWKAVVNEYQKIYCRQP